MERVTDTNRTFPKQSSDMAKGIAILFMLFYHLFSVPTDNAIMQVNYSPLSEDVFLTIAKFGNICVPVFIFLTSYGISRKIFAKDDMTLKEAYNGTWKRAGMLLLRFLFMFAFVNLIWFRCFNYALCYGEGKQGVLAFITDALGLSHFFGTPSLNMTWWYMSVAYTLVFIVPVLAYLCKKTGSPFLGIAFLIPFLLPVEFDIARYFFVIGFGIFAAYENFFERIINSKFPFVLRWIIEIAFIILCIPARQNEFVQEHLVYLFDAVIAFGIVLFAADFIAAVPGLRNVFAFLGKHSMNIFFVHTFFYLILYRDFVFRFRYAGVTFVILLALSLALSLVLYGLWNLLAFLLGKLKQKKQAPEGTS